MSKEKKETGKDIFERIRLEEKKKSDAAKSINKELEKRFADQLDNSYPDETAKNCFE